MSTHAPGFKSYYRFSHHFVLAKLASSSIRINPSDAGATFAQCTKSQNLYEKSSKPCHVGIHWKALAENYHRCTHVPGFCQHAISSKGANPLMPVADPRRPMNFGHTYLTE